jgi:hypothetical protein
VHYVEMGSAAEALGLNIGDEILSVNDVDVTRRPLEGKRVACPALCPPPSSDTPP